MVHAGSAGPPQLYSWTVVTDPGDPPRLGALGVSDNRDRALSALADALQAALPGARGVLHKVTVSVAEVGYWYDSELVRAQVDPDSGDVRVDELPDSGGWGLFNQPFGALGGAR